MAKDIFDAESMMRDQGLTLTGVAGPGIYNVQTSDGGEAQLNLAQMLRDQGADLNKIDIKVNSPASPLTSQGLDFSDRAKLMLGNEAGAVSYLKKKFQGVDYNPDHGIVVNNNGVWQAVDPSGLGGGDAWEMTKELAKDVLDIGDLPAKIAAGTAGATAGLVGGPAGSAAGAGAATAGVEGLRTSLGRLVGTYAATPQEQIRDIGMEFLLNAGGQAVGLAVKPTINMMKGAVQRIKALAPGESQALIKQVVAESVGKATGAGPRVVEDLFAHTDDVFAAQKAAGAGKLPYSNVLEGLKSQQVDILHDAILAKAPKRLSSMYAEKEAQLIRSAAKNGFSVDLKSITTEAFDDLVEQGLLVRNTTEGGTQLIGSGKGAYRAISPSEAGILAQDGKAAQALSEDAMDVVNKLVKGIEQYTEKLKPVSGAPAGKVAMQAKKNLNELFRSVRDSADNPNAERLVDTIRGSWQSKFASRFEGEMSNAYRSTIEPYERYGDAVGMARRLLNSEGGQGAEVLLNQITAKNSNMNVMKREIVGDLAELLGDDGVEAVKQIRVRESAKAFSSWLPTSIIPGGLAAAAGAGVATGMVDPELAIPVAMMSSPKGFSYAFRGLKWMAGLSPAQRVEFLQNPNAIRTMAQIMANGSQEEAAITERLVQEAAQ
jgi:hypothetical protein